MAGDETTELQGAIEEVERLGDELLGIKQQLVEADRQWQAAREALVALRKGTGDGGGASGKRPWVQLRSGVMVKLDAQAAVAVLQRETAAAEARTKALRAQQKDVTAQLAGLGLRPDSAGPGLLRALLELQGGAG